jgi:uncharacterized protein (TIGR00251 family)
MILEALKAALLRDGSIEFTVKVIPKSSRSEIAGLLEDGSVRLKVTAAPERGKANAAVCELLAEAFGVARTSVSIIRGETSQTKRIRLIRR